MNDSTQEIPLGWASVELGDLIEQMKVKADPTKLADLPYIGLEHIEKDLGRLEGHGLSSEVRSTKSHFYRGELLYGKLRPYLNKVCIPDFDGICSTDILVLRPKEGILTKYLLYRLLSADFVQYAQSNVSGVQHPRVSFKTIATFQFNISPSSEQYRIVAKIEELFTQLDAGVEALETARKQLKRYRQSVLKAAVEGKLTATWREQHGHEAEPASHLLERILQERRAKWEAEQLAKYEAKGKKPPKNWQQRYKEPTVPDTTDLPQLPGGWVWATPEHLAAPHKHSLAIGPFGSNLKVSDYRDEGMPLIFVRNIRTGIYDGTDSKFVSKEKAIELQAHKADPDDILITKMGDPPGDANLYPTERPPAIITADCIKWTLSSLLSDKVFFVHATNSYLLRKQILRITRGVAQQKISLGRFKKIAYPVPSLAEQRAIIQGIERLFSVIHETEKTIKYELQRAQSLRQSILKQAFEGRLVPQDPTDEPASALLERIRKGALDGKTKGGQEEAETTVTPELVGEQLSLKL